VPEKCTEVAPFACAGALSARELSAIPLLVDGRLTRREVCEALGVSPSCLYKWLDNEDFMEEYERQKLARYQANLQLAGSVLRVHMEGAEPKLQQGAAKIVYDYDVGQLRAGAPVTNVIILDKLQTALQGTDSAVVDAEYTAIADGVGTVPALDAPVEPDGDDHV
jgi:hypothetical protein